MSTGIPDEVLNGPALLPPEGITPNFDDPVRHNVPGYAILSTCLILGSIAIFVRLYTQIFHLRKVHIEDFLGFAGYALFVTYIVACIKIVDNPGFFVHQWDVRVRELSRIQYIFYICSNAYSDAIECLKAAILLSWLRIFNPLRISKTFHWSCHIILWLNILYYAVSAIVINVACTPHSKIWDVTIVGGHCIDRNAFYLSGTIVNLISDVAILILPQKVIWSLHTSTLRKLGVSVIFGIGIMCIIIACFRIESTIALAKETDVVYKLASLSFWGAAEMVLVLFVFCVPSFPKAFQCGEVARTRPSAVSDSGKRSFWKSGGSSWKSSKASGDTYNHLDEHSLERLTLTPAGHAPERTIVSNGVSNLGTQRGITRISEFRTTGHYTSERPTREDPVV